MPKKINPEEPVKSTAEAPEEKKKNKGGRPRKEINKEQFECLANGGCTEEFTAKFFNCSKDTLTRFCKREYGMSFADFQRNTKQWRKTMVSNKMFEVAMKGDTKMLIWLSKAWLGMSENGPKQETQNQTSKLYEVLDADEKEEDEDEEIKE